MGNIDRVLRAVGLALVAATLAGAVHAARISDIRNTKHNLSSSGTGTVRSTTESQICVFCHTPHGATPGVGPLWNREVKSAYTVYTSSSLDAGSLDLPGGSSKMCLSCHDGTIAIGSVNVLSGKGSPTVQGTQMIQNIQNAPGGFMPGSTTSGYTRNLGTDLSNDHPISVSYTSTLATQDGELKNVSSSQKWPVSTGDVIGIPSPGHRPMLPLEPTGSGGTGQIQCATCHNPHFRETDTTKGNQKFLRTNRFQEGLASSPTYSQDNDIICLSCHDRNKDDSASKTASWSYSAHGSSQVGTQRYTNDAADTREFRRDLEVWRAACLNCHDTHTVPGARRLLRAGVDGNGVSAIEQTCYQCHSSGVNTVLQTYTSVPNVQTDFTSTYRMPITSTDQQNGGTEAHDIIDHDFTETQVNLGSLSNTKRHAECTDCHNPHRVMKFRTFLGPRTAAGALSGTIASTPDAAGTHLHPSGTPPSGYLHNNVASGVLRGIWGVEPVYTSQDFNDNPSTTITFTVKKGDPLLTSSGTGTNESYVTREYQICLKCHSHYGYSDDNVYPNSSTRPSLRAPGTTSWRSTTYTNQAKEFQAPANHRGEGTSGSNPGVGASYLTDNHRSWHPVIASTGRTGAIRGASSIDNNWENPWAGTGRVGSQTMYCSDCHGSNVTSNTSVEPDGNTSGEDGSPWGPHGSNNPFILKGFWGTAASSSSMPSNTICFKCHKSSFYASTSSTNRTGFWIGSGRGSGKDGHFIHNNNNNLKIKCYWCHVAVPHGWKNKALLVNLNDVGTEAATPAPGVISDAAIMGVGYTQGPYYMKAMLRVKAFRQSGQWTMAYCGSGAAGDENSSNTWMRDNNGTCKNPP